MSRPDAGPDSPLPILYRDHARRWRDNAYVYPVVSRRSGGLSIGINLNPDKACNFDCIYCQVDRRTPPTIRRVDLDILRDELSALLEAAQSGALFEEPPFNAVPPDQRVVADIAFSGDGEPTTFPQFDKAVDIAIECRDRLGLAGTKIVLITDACYLTKPGVREALTRIDRAGGEIWAKLDAGTEAYYRDVNRPNYPLQHVIDNIIDAARVRPVVIQSLFMRVHGEKPPTNEIAAYIDRLHEIVAAGGRIKLVQLYTIARETTEPYATMLSDTEMDALTDQVRAGVSVPIATYYGVA